MLKLDMIGFISELFPHYLFSVMTTLNVSIAMGIKGSETDWYKPIQIITAQK